MLFAVAARSFLGTLPTVVKLLISPRPVLVVSSEPSSNLGGNDLTRLLGPCLNDLFLWSRVVKDLETPVLAFLAPIGRLPVSISSSLLVLRI